MDVEQARDRLLEERAESLGRLALLTRDFQSVVDASRDSNADDEHDPEGATIAFERSQIGALVLQVQQRLREVDAALGRLDTGTYLICERCGGPIGAGRLEVRPTARRCVRCAAQRPGT